MTSQEILADKFYRVFYEKAWPGTLTPPVSDLTIDEAYQVQDMVMDRRTAKGETVVGYKVGCTSQAIRTQFGLEEPISARLFRPYLYEDRAELDWTALVNCAIEPEIVLRIGRDLRGEHLSDKELVAAIDSVSPGIELHQFKFWYSPPTSQELICAGGINAGLVVGPQQVAPERLSFRDELFRVFKDGQPITSGPATEIMGGPLHSLRWLVGSLHRRGTYLPAGSLVIPGSPVELISIDEDTLLRVEIEQVGSVAARSVR